MQGALEPIDDSGIDANGFKFALEWHRSHADPNAADDTKDDTKSLACAEYWMRKRARQNGLVSVS
jgi:hypothetical protein